MLENDLSSVGIAKSDLEKQVQTLEATLKLTREGIREKSVVFKLKAWPVRASLQKPFGSTNNITQAPVTWNA